jgi:hypothetical protein
MKHGNQGKWGKQSENGGNMKNGYLTRVLLGNSVTVVLRKIAIYHKNNFRMANNHDYN